MSTRQQAIIWTNDRYLIIQFKICAEYRDMLRRARLVCQEHGLRPIGLSPGLPDKSSPGLGGMSWYSAKFLICFIASIFHCFHSSVGLIGNFAGLPPCTVPSAIVHCSQNEAAHQTIKSPSMPCWGAAVWKHSLEIMPQNWLNWQINWMKSVSMGSFQYRSQVNGEFYCIHVSYFTVLQPRIETDFRNVRIRSRQVVWKFN